MPIRFVAKIFAALAVAATLAACAGSEPSLPPLANAAVQDPNYQVGAGDTLQIVVWRNTELSVTAPVRPDGFISVPLVGDLRVEGKTPETVSREISDKLRTYVQNPVVTVVVSGFTGSFGQQIRVIGQAPKPQAIPYRAGMTLLDVMIAVGGTTEFAAGNRATVVRQVDGKPQSYRVRLDDLIKDGDITANGPLMPGDVLIIPEAWF